MSSPPSKSDFERLSHFRHRLRCYLRASENLCQAEGVTLLQYQLLLHVMGFPDREWATVGEIAERLQAKQHGVVALLDRCEKLDLVQRRPSQADRRQVEIHLRPKGRELVSRLAAAHRSELELLQQEFMLPGWTQAGSGDA